MSMKQCPACGHRVSSSARACPACGDNLESRRSWLWAMALFIVIPAAAIISSDRDDAPPAVSKVTVSPKPLEPPPAKEILPPIEAADVAMVPADYKSDVAQMLNLLRAGHPKCAEALSPISAGMASSQPDPANPLFFVQCGAPNSIVVRFTWMDAVNKRIPDAPLTIGSAQAAAACRSAAKEKAAIPSSVDLSTIMDASFSAHGDGSSTYRSTFTASNALGVTQRFNISCSFTGLSLGDVRVWPES